MDPDVDRLVLICEDGSFFGEEYTIVAITKYILSRYPNSSVVSNLSTTSAVRDVAYEMGAKHYESAVGEINVVELMKENKSIIGGEGSGGVIFSLSHYGRDALVGIALFLSYLANLNKTMTELKDILPSYHMLKEKILIPKNLKFHFDDFVSHQIQICHQNQLEFVLIDGIKIYYSDRSWSHIRISNTEPLIRLIIESNSSQRNKEIKKSLISVINNYLK